MKTAQWKARDRHAERIRTVRGLHRWLKRLEGKRCDKCGALLTEGTGVAALRDILNVTPGDSNYLEQRLFGQTQYFCQEHAREPYMFVETAQGRFVKLDPDAEGGAWPLTREQLTRVYGV